MWTYGLHVLHTDRYTHTPVEIVSGKHGHHRKNGNVDGSFHC